MCIIEGIENNFSYDHMNGGDPELEQTDYLFLVTCYLVKAELRQSFSYQ